MSHDAATPDAATPDAATPDAATPNAAAPNVTHSSAALPMGARRGGPLRGRVRVPGDKSISHRALIFGALAVGETRISGLLEGEDVLRTAAAVRALGASVERLGAGEWRVRGVGVGGFAAPAAPLDFGNAGTGSRLMMGAVAGCPIRVGFDGDASLRKRPMGRILDPLRRMGASVPEVADGQRLPLVIEGAREPLPIVYATPVPSAQIKSAVLLAGLAAPGATTVIETQASRDHTERLLRHFGADVAVTPEGSHGRRITLAGQPELRPAPVVVPADPSSAAFPLAAAVLVPGSDIVLEGVMMNPLRTGLITTLREMGGNIEAMGERQEGGDAAADLRVRAGALRGVDVPAERAPSMIDEYPVLAVVAAFAEGETRMRGLQELRVKESDRLAVMLAGLRANGVDCEIVGDDLIVQGRGGAARGSVAGGGVPGGGLAATHMDHRIAMSFLVLGLASVRPVGIDDGAFIATSFPDFVPMLRALGAEIG